MEDLRKGALLGLGLLLVACSDDGARNPFDSSQATSGVPTVEPATEDGDPEATAGTAAGTGDGTADDDASDDGLKLDVGAGDIPGPCVGEGCNEEGCTGVDLLFVIDNSGSMGDYQNALGLAFPAFASTLDSALPMGTSLHVGVTSTEMGFSGSGSTSIFNGNCTFQGDGGQPNDAFYITPDVMNTMRNGAQGRLYDPGDGTTFFDYTTGTGGAALANLQAWFTSAANIGTGGSNIEMSTAPVGWVADPANAATNAGFVRDAGSVLVVFFMQDEPDQTPLMIGGQPGGIAMLDQLLLAKQACGGAQCVVAGGFLNENACTAMGNLPLDDFLANVGAAPVVQPLPDENLAQSDPQAAADEMNTVLSGTLADLIAQTCDEIGPEG